MVRRGGLPPGCADRARVEQLLIGAVYSDMMLVQLKLRERKESPPSFLELLSKIHNEEEYESSRMKLNPSVQQVHAKSDIDNRQIDIQNLRSEIQELKSMFTSMVTPPGHAVAADNKEPESLTKVPTPETCVDNEVGSCIEKASEKIAKSDRQKVKSG